VAPATPPPPTPAGSPAIGTEVTALPDGCKSLTKDNQSYFECGGVYYKPAFQGTNLVYVVQAKP